MPRRLTRAEERFGSPLPPIAGGEPTAGELREKAEKEQREKLPILDQLRAQRKEKIDAAASAIEQREKDRTEFSTREQELIAEARKEIESITRKADEAEREVRALPSARTEDEVRERDEARQKRDEDRRAAIKEVDRPLNELRSTFRAAEEGFKAEHAQRMREVEEYDQRISEQEVIELRKQVSAQASKGEVHVVSEPRTYRRDNSKEISYFRDLAVRYMPTVASRIGNPAEAEERLVRHGAEMDEELPKRAAERQRRAEEQMDRAEREFTGSFLYGVQRRGLSESPFEYRVTPNRTDGQGGFFIPPLWLIEEYIPALRAGRVTAELCRQMDLPEGTDSINIPKLGTTTKVAPQNQDAAAVASQDFTDTSVQANVKTLAGQEDVAIQLIEQSPGQIIDQVIMEDLLADYNRLVDREVLFAPGTETKALNAGQIQGIYPSTNWSGTNLITWTSAGPLGPGFNMVAGAMASKVAYNRFNLQNFHYVMHPRRWFWFATSLDGSEGKTGRPIVGADGFGPFNVSALENSNLPFEGLAGRFPFGPVSYIDANVPSTDNGSGVLSGENDVAIAAKWDDLWLFEGDLRTRVLPEVLSGTLEIRYQVYNYVAFLVRYGQSIAIAQGTGFSAPVSAIDASVKF